MKSIPLAALSILVLLAVVAPSLAAENSTSDQQPAPQYSKLPALQMPSSPLTQKEHLQSPPPTSHNLLSQLGIDNKIFFSSMAGALAGGIVTLLSVIVTNIFLLKNTNRQFKNKIKENALEACKPYCLEFLDTTVPGKIHNLGAAELLRLDFLVTAINAFSDDTYTSFVVRFGTHLKRLVKTKEIQKSSDNHTQETNSISYREYYSILLGMTNRFFSGGKYTDILKYETDRLQGKPNTDSSKEN